LIRKIKLVSNRFDTFFNQGVLSTWAFILFFPLYIFLGLKNCPTSSRRSSYLDKEKLSFLESSNRSPFRQRDCLSKGAAKFAVLQITAGPRPVISGDALHIVILYEFFGFLLSSVFSAVSLFNFGRRFCLWKENYWWVFLLKFIFYT